MASTAGLQPWRKAFHAASGVTIALGATFLDLTQGETLALLGGIGLVLLVADLVRLRSPRLNRLFFRTFANLASPREAARLASSTWYVFGALASLLLFPTPVAVSGILVLALADPIASVVGQLLGRRPFLGGTIEGSTTFVLVALMILMPRHGWGPALGAAALATLAERRSWPLDDNFSIPIATAFALAVIGRLVGA